MDFCDRLKIALERKGWSAADLARKTGIGEGAISCYKKGTYKASQRNLELIANALDVPIPWLMGLEDEECANQAKEFADLFSRLTPEQQERELAYIRSLVDNR